MLSGGTGPQQRAKLESRSPTPSIMMPEVSLALTEWPARHGGGQLLRLGAALHRAADLRDVDLALADRQVQLVGRS